MILIDHHNSIGYNWRWTSSGDFWHWKQNGSHLWDRIQHLLLVNTIEMGNNDADAKKKRFKTWAMYDMSHCPSFFDKVWYGDWKIQLKTLFDKRYDMVTDIPNAYFVEVGIYKWHGSPTYTLGRWKWILKKWFEMAQIFKVWKKEMSNYFSFRGTSFGAALHYRSVPMLFAAIADLALINIFNRCCL